MNPIADELYQQILKYSNEVTSFHFQDCQSFLEQVVQSVESHQELFLNDMMVTMTRCVKFKKKFALEVLDTEFESSTFAVPTDENYNADDYDSVADFFEELTGNSIIVDESDTNTVAENWEWYIREQLEEMFEELVFSMSDKFEDEWAEVGEILSEWLVGIVDKQMVQLKNTTFSWMIKSKSDEAQLVEMYFKDKQLQEKEKLENRAKISHYVHSQTKLLLKKDYYDDNDRDELLDLLSQLSHLVSSENLAIYLHSSKFATMTSLELRELIQEKYPLLDSLELDI